jgi:hypothetical protein
MSGSYANAAARRRRAAGNSSSVQSNSEPSYASVRQQQQGGYASVRQQQHGGYGSNSYRNVPNAPPGKIHIQQAFDILIQRVNSMELELQSIANHKQDDYSSHISLLFEKLNSIERRFNTLVNDNEESLNVENIKEVKVESHNEFEESNDGDTEKESVNKETTTFNFVKKEELNQAVSNVVAKEEFNQIMSSVGKDIGDITERTMQLNELLLQVQNGNIMLNNAISTIRQEMKKRYVVDSKSTSTDVVADKEVNPTNDLKSMNKDEIAEEVKRELNVVAADVNDSNDEDDEGASNEDDEAESNE